MGYENKSIALGKQFGIASPKEVGDEPQNL